MRVGSMVGALTLIVLATMGTGEALAAQKYDREVLKYEMPDVTLVNQRGQEVRFLELLESRNVVMVDFVYGTCTTICPVLSAGFSNFQRKVGEDRDQVHLISVTIDPEHDTPEIMSEYLDRYAARPGWDFLTGSREDIDKVMHAFDAYVGNKMNHKPLTFLKARGSEEWVRLYGLMGTSDLLREYRKLAGRSGS